MRAILIAGCLALASCGTTSSFNNTVASVSDQVVLKSTTALSLGELAFTSAEQTATATLRSGHLSKTQAAQLGDAVHEARGYRDRARMAVANEQDASAALTGLSDAIAAIYAATGK